MQQKHDTNHDFYIQKSNWYYINATEKKGFYCTVVLLLWHVQIDYMINQINIVYTPSDFHITVFHL